MLLYIKYFIKYIAIRNKYYLINIFFIYSYILFSNVLLALPIILQDLYIHLRLLPRLYG
ncbi:MAG: hypothetical protein RLZZ210_397 [Pseudomonadota bacterium]